MDLHMKVEAGGANTYLKADSYLLKKLFIFSTMKSPLKVIKKVFYFVEKTLFALEIFTFSS